VTLIFSAALSRAEVAQISRHVRAYVGRVDETRSNAFAGSVHLSAPFPIFTLSRGAGRKRRLLTAAKPVCLECLVLVGEHAVADIALVISDSSGQHEFAGMRVGPSAARLLEAIRTAEGIEATKNGEYELRVLRVPALRFSGVWLHRTNDDLLIPFGQKGPSQEGSAPCSERELQMLLAPRAEARPAAARRRKRA
jgi:hypothetical protein